MQTDERMDRDTGRKSRCEKWARLSIGFTNDSYWERKLEGTGVFHLLLLFLFSNFFFNLYFYIWINEGRASDGVNISIAPRRIHFPSKLFLFPCNTLLDVPTLKAYMSCAPTIVEDPDRSTRMEYHSPDTRTRYASHGTCVSRPNHDLVMALPAIRPPHPESISPTMTQPSPNPTHPPSQPNPKPATVKEIKELGKPPLPASGSPPSVMPLENDPNGQFA